MSHDVQLLPVSAVHVADRLRPVDEAYVDYIARSLDEQGLNEPIVVRPNGKPGRWKLVAGAHRLAAAARLGWKEIPAVVRQDLANDDEARLVEIAENLVRRELNALDRAIFLREWRETMCRLHPELRQGGDHSSAEFQWKRQNGTLSLWSDIAPRVGLSTRTIQRACSLADRLDPKTVERLQGTEWADKRLQLNDIASLPAKEQLKAAEALIANGPPAKEKASDDQLYRRLTGLYNSMPLRIKNRFLREHLQVEAKGK